MDYTYLDFLALYGVGGAHPGGLQLTKSLLAKENIGEDHTVLDAGCGTGQTSAYISSVYNCHVTSLDNSEIMLEKAKKRFFSLQLPIEVKHGTTERLPFNEGDFNLVLSESVCAFTELNVTLAEFKRVLKNNGKLIAIEMVIEKQLPEYSLASISKFYGLPQLLTETEWVKAFTEAGFKDITVEKYEIEQEPDLNNATEFSLSENLSENLLQVLETHETLIERYKDILGYRIFKCKI